jgi:hypothetical protein
MFGFDVPEPVHFDVLKQITKTVDNYSYIIPWLVMDVTEPLYQVPDPKKLSVHHFCVYPQNSTVGTRKEY